MCFTLSMRPDYRAFRLMPDVSAVNWGSRAVCKTFARHDNCINMGLALPISKVIDIWATLMCTLAAAECCQGGDIEAGICLLAGIYLHGILV